MATGTQIRGEVTRSVTRFGLFEADFRNGELRRSGVRIKLQDQPLQILGLLLEKPGEIVSREELRARLWPANTFVDFDHSLNTAVKRLRDALGDTADNPRFVETIARRGYRFIAPVTSEVATSIASEAPPPETWTTKHQVLLVAMIALLASALIGGWSIGRRSTVSAPIRISERRVTANPSELPLNSAVISRDGKYVAYSDAQGLFLRVLETNETRSVNLPQGFRPYVTGWFPDGTHLLVRAIDAQNNKPALWSVSVLGAKPRKIMDDADWGSLSRDGQHIAFVRGDKGYQSLWIANISDEKITLIASDKLSSIGAMDWSPNGQWLAYERGRYTSGHFNMTADLVAYNVNTGKTSVLLADNWLSGGLAWSAPDRLQFARAELPPSQNDSNIWELSLDRRTGSPVGPPTRITSGPDHKVAISVSEDGKKLLYLRTVNDPDVFIGEIETRTGRVNKLKRLTLDEGKDLPFAWTQDSKTVLFVSNRDGASHAFRQSIDQNTPELFIGGPDSIVMTRMNPEQSGVLYLVSAQSGDREQLSRLMELPLSGGTPRKILESAAINNFQCAFLPSKLCLMSDEMSTSALIIYQFDEQTGEKKEVTRITDPESFDYNWTLSRDGSRLAIAKINSWSVPSSVRILELSTRQEKLIPLPAGVGAQYLDWAADSKSIWVSAVSGEKRSLVNLDLNGQIKTAFDAEKPELGWAIPSPDGKRLAILQGTRTSNAWLVER